jgi:acyl-CoA thioesterase FadM
VAVDPREDRFIVEAFDCRPDGFIKPNALMQYLQEAAARHAEQLGVGFADLEQWDCFWVLVNLRLEMTDTPRWRDGLTIRTWPSGCTRLLAAREFVGEGADGRELFRASSEWMILDKHGSRPRNLGRWTSSAAHRSEGSRTEPSGSGDRRMRNRHDLGAFQRPWISTGVNNTEYVRWAFDGLPALGHAACTLGAGHLRSRFEGDDIEFCGRAGANSCRRTQSRRAGGRGVFLMEIERAVSFGSQPRNQVVAKPVSPDRSRGQGSSTVPQISPLGNFFVETTTVTLPSSIALRRSSSFLPFRDPMKSLP